MLMGDVRGVHLPHIETDNDTAMVEHEPRPRIGEDRSSTATSAAFSEDAVSMIVNGFCGAAELGCRRGEEARGQPDGVG